MRTTLVFVFPGAALLVAAVVLAFVGLPPEWESGLVRFYPATVLIVGVFLGGRFNRSRLVFAVIALAPMPMFAAFGLLTALMILMAFTASLFVLPSLLMFVEEHEERRSRASRRGS